MVVTLLLVWPWFASVVLAGFSFILRQETVERYWALPLWTVPQIPVGVAALMLIHNYRRTFTAPAMAGSS
jgi:hypothetical protein